MDPKQQDKSAETPVISPLANEKTYGERQYSRIFDWGLNYWTNLLGSAGFSHWAANSTKEIKVPFFEKAAPRVLQEKLGEWISSTRLMNGYKARQIAEHGEQLGMEFLKKRGFAMAESLTLLVPGFAVMIPSVYLGAKWKPAIVEWFNKRHYGEDAMDDPSLQARHEALRAETRPTLLGTIVARLGTVGMVQLSAKLIGSESNTINWIGKKTNVDSLKNFKGINPAAEAIGAGIGGSLPESVRNNLNAKAIKAGFSWSNKQAIANQAAGITGPYNQTAQDLAKYVAMDTMYTAVSAGTIHPLIRLIRKIPGMSYTPKSAANTPTLDGDKIKVPANRYADAAPIPAANDPIVGELSRAEPAANDEKFNTEAPTHKVHSVNNHTKMAETTEQKRAQG